jgi:transcriptional regulator with XRE-family HTH domain
METFGQAARRHRGTRSLREVARQAHLDPGHLSRIETGKRRPTLRLARTLDTVYSTNGALTELVPTDRATDIPHQRLAWLVEQFALTPR